MYKNYFYLCRCARQLDSLTRESFITEAYTQEKDKLFLRVPLRDAQNFHLIISTASQNPFIAVKDEHYKAKKNTVNFFQDYLPGKVNSVQIASGDRIIKFNLSTGSLIILFRGSKSTAVFIDKSEKIVSFHKLDEKERRELLDEINSINFLNASFDFGSLVDDDLTDAEVKKLPFIGKDILGEAEKKKGDLKTGIKSIIDEILNGKIEVHFDEKRGRALFQPESFVLNSTQVSSNYESYFEALHKYFSLGYSKSNIQSLRKQIEGYLTREIEITASKLNSLKIRVESGSKEELYRNWAALLQMNRDNLRKGMKDVEINSHKIVLDEKMSPSQNIDRYFEKSKDEKIEYEKSKELFSAASEKLKSLIKIRDKFELAADHNELAGIKKELKMSDQIKTQEDKIDRPNFRHFVIAGKYDVYVGKDSRNNDMLTTRFAKQNDFWFHARSVSGSHVVLRINETKEPVPKSILLKAASLAAFYSKAKTSKLAPVSYTLKKYVNKNSRHEPGQVSLIKEEVLLVKPEIPKDCIQVDE